MVYVGNIKKLHSSLTQNEELVLFFKSGNTSVINKKSELKSSSGDLEVSTKVESRGGESLYRLTIVDCAEVEKISVMKRFKNEF